MTGFKREPVFMSHDLVVVMEMAVATASYILSYPPSCFSLRAHEGEPIGMADMFCVLTQSCGDNVCACVPPLSLRIICLMR